MKNLKYLDLNRTRIGDRASLIFQELPTYDD